MKNFYILLSAACVAVSASAVEREMVAPMKDKGAIVGHEMSKSVAPISLKSMKAIGGNSAHLYGSKKAARAGEKDTEVSQIYFRPADNVMMVGMNPEGNGYQGIGFASPYGSVNFWNFSLGINDMEWNYSNLEDYKIEDNKVVWNTSTSAEYDLSVKSGVGAFLAPTLKGNAGAEAVEASGCAEMYYCGGAPWYYMGEYGEDLGITFYQNTFMTDDEGSTGAPLAEYAYFPGGVEGFEDNGVSSSWYDVLGQYFEGKKVTDLEMQNITVFLPKTPSAYLMSQGWIYLQVTANAATQLVSYIYPINEEDGKISENPIAVGYASIPKGVTPLPHFYYNALDENGDEIEGDICISSGVAVTIEGFNGNTAINNMMTISGFYPVNLDLYQYSPYDDVLKSPDLYTGLSCKIDGEQTNLRVAFTGLYYFDEARENVSMYCYSQFCMDALFPWIMSVNGEESVTLPLEGGEADIDINAMFYDISAMIEDGQYVVESSDWINVAFGKSDQQTGNTTMTVSVDATDADRVGSVEISGLGLTYSLKVVQGVDNAVNVIVTDSDAQYFDLQGRRVANPDKGIYIKKSGNKTSKVIL